MTAASARGDIRQEAAGAIGAPPPGRQKAGTSSRRAASPRAWRARG